MRLKRQLIIIWQEVVMNFSGITWKNDPATLRAQQVSYYEYMAYCEKQEALTPDFVEITPDPEIIYTTEADNHTKFDYK